MLFSLGIEPIDIVFFVIPLFLAIFFYSRSARGTYRDRDKFILFILSVISIVVWIWYTFKFLSHLLDKVMYGGY